MTRSIAQQTQGDLGGPISVLTRQRMDHIRLEHLLRELEHADDQNEDAVIHRINRLVFPHAFAEEAVLWPALRAVLRDGEALTLLVEQEHQVVNELVKQLESSGVGHHDRPRVLRDLVSVLREDVRDEEDMLLPRLQEAVTARKLKRLGIVWQLVRWTAPTRPHPYVARRPPGNVIAAFPLAIVDRLRDLVDLATRHVPAPARQGLRPVSAGLSAVSSAIEKLPIMRSGEDSRTFTTAADGYSKDRA